MSFIDGCERRLVATGIVPLGALREGQAVFLSFPNYFLLLSFAAYGNFALLTLNPICEYS